MISILHRWKQHQRIASTAPGLWVHRALRRIRRAYQHHPGGTWCFGQTWSELSSWPWYSDTGRFRVGASFFHVQFAWQQMLMLYYPSTLDSIRTHLVSILRGAPDGEFVVWMGIKCSSWVSISQPSCGRSYLDPMGYETHNNTLANAMVGRTVHDCIC